LGVRRFTPQMKTIINLIATDVGRPLADLASNLEYPEIFADAREVSRTRVFQEKPVASRDGRWFSVRIMPYRTIEDRIEGLVMTFTNITALKTLEASLPKPSV
jgi:two-component system CheB/CheR fusion protein